jgi:hypothetical protein
VVCDQLFCRLASGGSFAVRRLYTDEDEVLLSAARPVVLNGIEEVITRPDLADRTIFLTLGPINEQQRRAEKELWREFELQRPSVLGALLDLAAHGLRSFSAVQIKRWPRMVDFAHWATACESAFAPPGTFLRAYSENRKAARDGVIEADPVAARIRELMARSPTWSGSASDLLRAGAAPAELSASSGGWPSTPRALAGRLRRAQTFLRILSCLVPGSETRGLGPLWDGPARQNCRPISALDSIRRLLHTFFTGRARQWRLSSMCRCKPCSCASANWVYSVSNLGVRAPWWRSDFFEENVKC